METERIDASHEHWRSTAHSVEIDPACATKRQLREAIRYLTYRRSSIILSARRRGVEPRGLGQINERLALYAGLLNSR